MSCEQEGGVILNNGPCRWDIEGLLGDPFPFPVGNDEPCSPVGDSLVGCRDLIRALSFFREQKELMELAGVPIQADRKAFER
ncbi:MAG: hypothetical protein ABEH38_07805 [Flavobacteriales bacterium]